MMLQFHAISIAPGQQQIYHVYARKSQSPHAHV